jgi:formamidopyrimidine-DNA glycosylase
MLGVKFSQFCLRGRVPELPEVETVRLGLLPVLVGAKVRRLEALRPNLRFPLPENFAGRVEGQTIKRLERRAKYLVAVLSGGDALVMHLGMTGRFTVARGETSELLGDYIYQSGGDPKHDHVVFHLSSGARIIYNDPRRFGFMLMMPEAERAQHALFKALGPEPLGDILTADYLARRAHGKKINLKAFLMDQRIVAGLGNIYVSEALHRAGLSPNRGARFLSDRHGRPTDRARALVPAIRSVLEQAITAGGSTLRDYRHADGEKGSFQDEFSVYDRDGQLCTRAGCGGEIKRTVQSGRATYFCGHCQK